MAIINDDMVLHRLLAEQSDFRPQAVDCVIAEWSRARQQHRPTRSHRKAHLLHHKLLIKKVLDQGNHCDAIVL